MHKIISVEVQSPFKLICHFKNGEIRTVDLDKVLDRNDKYTKKVLAEETFQKVKIDPLGGIYWEGIAEMKDINGQHIPCEYDISAELIYAKSSPINPTVKRN
ncbi:MAG: DUF2442 domain-containing protein [Bacteroidota bacterium]